jgi:mRNA interferase HigB
MSKGKFKSHNDLKMKFPDMDYVGNDRFVFNIAGNKYRLIALVNFNKQKVYVRFIGTHADYNRTNCKTI